MSPRDRLQHGGSSRAEPAAAKTDREGGLAARLSESRPVLLDGATGTELERRGVHAGLPLWSTHALLEAQPTLRDIHRDYAEAGAEIITASTFRTQRRALDAGSDGKLGGQDRELTRRALELAREATAHAPQRVWLAGSAPTLEDCYEPARVPDNESLRREHVRHAENLAAAGCDLILVETMNTSREAAAASRAAQETGLLHLVSFVCWEDAHLLSGESLIEAVSAVLPHAPTAVLVNCLPPSAVGACLPVLRDCGVPFGVYANLGAPDRETGFARSESCSPQAFSGFARQWCDAGARLVGGCCGTTPAHVRALSRMLDAIGPAS